MNTKDRYATWTVTGGSPGYRDIKATCTGVTNSPQKQEITVWKAVITDNQHNTITTPQSTIVGKKVTLKGTIIPPSVTPTGHLWALGGSPIKDYTQTTIAGTKVDLAAGDLNQAQVGFYWTAAAAANNVKYTATVGAQSADASVSYAVARPTATLGSTTTTDQPPVNVGNPGFGGGDALYFGSIASPGIAWTAGVDTTAKGAGTIAFTQLINTDRRATLDDANSTKKKFVSGGFVLDGAAGIQLGGTTSIGNLSFNTRSGEDSPATLLANKTKASASDTFKLYLMYKPDGGDSIWVTLAVLKWDWSGKATKGARGWTMDAAGSAAKSPIGSDSVELPQWGSNFSSVEWVDE